jgi:hypothetical protein
MSNGNPPPNNQNNPATGNPNKDQTWLFNPAMMNNWMAGATMIPVGLGIGSAIAAYRDMLRGRRSLSTLDLDRAIIEEDNPYLNAGNNAEIELPKTDLEKEKEQKVKKLTESEQKLLEQFGGENTLLHNTDPLSQVQETTSDVADILRIKDLLNRDKKTAGVGGRAAMSLLKWIAEHPVAASIWGGAGSTGLELSTDGRGYGVVRDALYKATGKTPPPINPSARPVFDSTIANGVRSGLAAPGQAMDAGQGWLNETSRGFGEGGILDSDPGAGDRPVKENTWGLPIVIGAGGLSALLGYGAISHLLENKRKQDVADETYNAKREFQKALVYEATQAKKRKTKRGADENSELMQAVQEYQDSIEYADIKLQDFYQKGYKYAHDNPQANPNNPPKEQDSWGTWTGKKLSPTTGVSYGLSLGAILALIYGNRAYQNAKREQETRVANQMLGIVKSPNDVIEHLAEAELSRNPPVFTVKPKRKQEELQLLE